MAPLQIGFFRTADDVTVAGVAHADGSWSVGMGLDVIGEGKEESVIFAVCAAARCLHRAHANAYRTYRCMGPISWSVITLTPPEGEA